MHQSSCLLIIYLTTNRGPLQLTVDKLTANQLTQSAEKGGHRNTLLSPEPFYPNPHFVTNSL